MGIRTDIAAESVSQLEKFPPEGIAVVKHSLFKSTLTMVEITSPEGAEAAGKPQGVYVTLEGKPFWQDAGDCREEIAATAAGLQELLPKEGLILTVGLGNREITPDALGPCTADRILATRHLQKALNQETGLTGLRETAVLTPNVMGKTGIEAAELVQSVVSRFRPAAVIAVDALAAGEIAHLGTTVQLCNTGIEPGSGVLNRRQALNRETLGVPVLAMGIPTVVDLESVSAGSGSSMMITPREIDLLIERGARFLSLCLNCALQPSLSLDEIMLLQS